MPDRIGYIYIRNNGTPEEFEAWATSMDDNPPIDDIDAKAEQELQWIRDHWEELQREMDEGDADIRAQRATRILAWEGSTSHPNHISRTFMLPSGGALMLSREVAEGSSLEATAAQADEAFRREGWAIPEVDRYEIVPGPNPDYWLERAGSSDGAS